MTGLINNHGTADEWLLFSLSLVVWVIVVRLFRWSRHAYLWSHSPDGRPETTKRQRRLVRQHYTQEQVRLLVATAILTAGIAGVLFAPPNPGIMTISARWKLWVIILIDILVGFQTTLAWHMQKTDITPINEQRRAQQENAVAEAEEQGRRMADSQGDLV